MIARLVWRSFLRRPGRSALLLAGYALGVGVTVALLSIGGALVAQSRDRSLVGGGDLTVLPAGLDLETFRTGGASSLHFTIGQAPFLYRQVLAGKRFRERVGAAAPWLDDELLYLRVDGEPLPVSAGGEIPSRAAALGAAPRVLEGRWEDAEADRLWTSPGDSALYAEIDAFHAPPPEARNDSSWAEWHYFAILLPEDRGWLYLTYLVGGRAPELGGALLATRVGAPGPDGRRAERAWSRRFPPESVRISTDRPDLSLGDPSPGDAAVRLGAGGRYLLRARVPDGDGGHGQGAVSLAGPLVVDLHVVPEGRRYLPPLEVSGSGFPSGYTAPVLRGRAVGRLCAGGECLELDGARAYHDHNWGTWRDVTWDWGTARLEGLDVLYGGVRREGRAAGGRFLYVTDSLGFAGLLPVTSIRHRPAPGAAAVDGDGPPGPAAIHLEARRGEDSLALRVEVDHVRASRPQEGSPGAGEARLFFQMRGRARLGGRLGGEPVDVRGDGFFETWWEPDGPPGEPR